MSASTSAKSAAADPDAPERVRLDRWLWAARWFKTRALAAAAVAGGKVRVNGQRPKRSRLIGPGDRIRIRKGPFEFEVVVHQVAQLRGPAAAARTLYQETEASRAARRFLALQLAAQPKVAYTGKGRPTKKARRAIERLQQLERGERTTTQRRR